MVKILTIGNSFADNATTYLEDLALADNTDILIGKANIGGCSLEKHWNLVQQCEKLPWVRPYNFHKSGKDMVMASLKDALLSEQWDYVTLQQVSDLSWKSHSYYPYIKLLSEFVKALSPQAEQVIHQTWSYRIDATEFKENGISQEEMFLCLKRAYNKVAEELKMKILPCGEAFQKARAIFNYVLDNKYNFKSPTPLELPNQDGSLIKGYYWSTGATASGKAELNIDGRHGNEKGCYLVGAVWYEMFTGKSILENTFSPENISEQELDILKACAHETVAQYKLRRI